MSSLYPSLQVDIHEEILDRFGNPRLKQARHHFLPLNQDAIPLLTECFEFWQTFDEYMILKGENVITGKVLYVARKCSKRGNDVFASRLKKSLGFIQSMDDVEFFNVRQFDVKKNVRTRLLWVTLTYDSKRCLLNEAWENCMKEYNLWITNLRNKYGHIDVLKFIQPFPDAKGQAYGYPHFHLVMLFRDHEFSVFPRLEANSEGKMQMNYRIKEKFEVQDQGKWHSFIDVKALSSARAVMNYCKSYAQNVCYGDSEKAILNSAILWLYRKQTYSLSGGFREKYAEFIRTKQGSKAQMMLNLGPSGEWTLEIGGVLEEWIWTFVGIRSVPNDGEWFKSLSHDEFCKVVGG